MNIINILRILLSTVFTIDNNNKIKIHTNYFEQKKTKE